MNIIQRPPNFQVMLAYNGDWEPEQLHYPVAVTPKLDGIRAFIQGGKAWTRACKKIPNKQLSKLLSQFELSGCDGEIIVPGLSFHELQSLVMTRDASWPIDWRYYIFDNYDSPYSYWGRIQLINELLPIAKFTWAKVLTPVMCHDAAELRAYHHKWVTEGFEGTIVRHPWGAYKHGRSTLKEELMLKFVDWRTDEAEIVSVLELKHNTCTATKEKANMEGGQVLGALVVDHKTWGQFQIGSGFDAAQRKALWDTPPIGDLVTFKYKPHGMKDKPRTPIFVGIRKDIV